MLGTAMFRMTRTFAHRAEILQFPLKQNSRYSLTRRQKYAANLPWSHNGPLGAENWGKWYPAANGKSQSPIPLYSDAPYRPLELQLNGYNTQAGLTACNVGSTVSFKSDCATVANSPCYITGVHGWWEKYSFNHMHMHWGKTSADGSEHTIDGRRYPMELHIVHCLGNLSLAEAVERPKGVAVLGFMYEISEEDNSAYIPLLEAMKHILRRGEKERVVTTPSVTLASLLPCTLDTSYFYYSGSLTTPPCSEVVHWDVFSHPIPISERQIETFRALHRCTGPGCIEPISGNWRPLQKVNDRQVYQSKDVNLRAKSS